MESCEVKPTFFPCFLALEKYFCDDTLKNTLNNVRITSYRIHNHRSLFFKFKKDRNSTKSKYAIGAATAALMYFFLKYLRIN